MASAAITVEKKGDDAAFLEKGKLLYDNNIRLITQTMTKKGLYVVQMGNMGEVLEIRRNAAGSKNSSGRPGFFRLICRGNGTVPTFGNTDALTETQKTVVQIMQKDFMRITNVVERDSRHGGGGGRRSETLRDRFGGLPVTEAELGLKEEKAKAVAAKAASSSASASARNRMGKKKSKRRKAKKEKVEESSLSFDDMLEALKNGVAPGEVDFEK